MKKKVKSLDLLFNRGEYEGVIKGFDALIDSIKDDEDTLMKAEEYRSLKIRSLMMLNKTDLVSEEITYINNNYHHHELVMYHTVMFLEHLGAEKEALLLRCNHRIVLATQCRIAKELGNAGLWAEFSEAFSNQPVSPREQKIKIQFDGGDYTSGEEPSEELDYIDEIVEFSINTEFPNDNMYIKVKIESDEFMLVASIPGPSNDAICEDGSIMYSYKNQEVNNVINRNDIQHFTHVSPFGILVSVGAINIVINNIHEINAKTSSEFIADR